MVRPFDKLTAHYKRNQRVIVRPELTPQALPLVVEGLNQAYFYKDTLIFGLHCHAQLHLEALYWQQQMLRGTFQAAVYE
jgi:hypothetical protein